MPLPPAAVPASAYTEDYYLNHIDGAAEFQAGLGREMPAHIKIAFRASAHHAGQMALDIGCGAGELLTHLTRAGLTATGFDYSTAALGVARQSLQAALASTPARVPGLALADGRSLPLATAAFDRVFMLDVVEHMAPVELHAALLEIRRVLKPGGRLVIHTMPNTWYYAIGYPLFRLVQRLRGVRLPANPRARHAFTETHINEQNVLSLRRALRRAGFTASVWLENAHDFGRRERSSMMTRTMTFLASAPGLRLIFCNDLFAVAELPAA